MDRATFLAAMASRSTPFDLLVIGGGATGFACALDAASRGWSVALVERGDFGSGTSTRSTKLIHGGVRYLRQGHLGLVHESLRERAWFLRAAPHLVHPLEFIIPCRSNLDHLVYRGGMRLYDTIAGADGDQRSASLSRDDVLARAPGIAPHGLTGGVRYIDGQLDDARWLVASLQRLVDEGGLAVNYAPVTALLKDGERVCGAAITDAETGRTLRIPARAVLNATGVYTDAVTRLDAPATPPRIAASQGIHLVLDAATLGGSSALMIPKTSDGRVLFAIPWHGRVLFGTTDTPRDTIDDDPQPLSSEIDYLLEHTGQVFARPPERRDLIATFAGLRPLPRTDGQRSSEVSRDFHVTVAPSGLVSVFGGKLTTARAMGEAAVDRVLAIAGGPDRPSRTRHWTFAPSREPASHLEPPDRDWVDYAIHHEMARTPDDLLYRRTRLGLLNPQAAQSIRPQLQAWLKTINHDP